MVKKPHKCETVPQQTNPGASIHSNLKVNTVGTRNKRLSNSIETRNNEISMLTKVNIIKELGSQ